MFRKEGVRGMADLVWRGGGVFLAGGALVLFCASLPRLAAAQEDHSGLTRESYRRNCLMCHSRAAPEGIAPDLLVGLRPEPGLLPAQAMPGVVCWRRCTTCWPANSK